MYVISGASQRHVIDDDMNSRVKLCICSIFILASVTLLKVTLIV